MMNPSLPAPKPAEPDPAGPLPGVPTGRVLFAVELLPGGGGNGHRTFLGHPDYRPRPARGPAPDPAVASPIAGPRALLNPSTNHGPREVVGSIGLAARRVTPAEAHDLARAAGLGPEDYRLVPVPPEVT